jgi:predicted AlkP superfamily phosphohydrolase/phosphomutase
MLVSDHGSGGTSDRAVFWNRWLAEAGFLAFKRRSAPGIAARTAKSWALSMLPPRLQAGLFARLSGAAGSVESLSRFGGIKWKSTRAYSEELNYFPSVWINLKGREPEGTVDECDRRAVEDDIIAALLELRDPVDQSRVVTAVHRREELYDGPFAGQVPDLVMELTSPAGYSYAGCSSRGGSERSPLRRLSVQEMNGERGTSMPGAHRPFGLCVLGGPRVRRGRYPDSTLHDAGATMMALAGIATAEGANGRVWTDALDLRTAGLRSAEVPPAADPTPLSSAGERELASRLRSLGYLE